MKRHQRIISGVAGAAVILASATALLRGADHGVKRTPSYTAAPSATIVRVPGVRGEISLDGDLDDTGWKGEVGSTGTFVDETGKPVGPHSEASILHDEEYLYLFLYASDIDIRAAQTERDARLSDDDHFEVEFDTDEGTYHFDVSATGVVSDSRKAVGETTFDTSWNAVVMASHEVDGTVNISGNWDEEWSVEMAIALESMHLRGEEGERVRGRMKRCDTLHDGERTCGTWGVRGPEKVLEWGDPPVAVWTIEPSWGARPR